MKTRKETKRIIIHHSLSHDVSAETIRGWHLARGWSDIGYHAVVRADGTKEKGRKLHLVGSHALGRNDDSIGVCVTGNFKETQPTLFQYFELARYCRALREVYGGDLSVEYHHEECPGPLFDRVFFGGLV